MNKSYSPTLVVLLHRGGIVKIQRTPTGHITVELEGSTECLIAQTALNRYANRRARLHDMLAWISRGQWRSFSSDFKLSARIRSMIPGPVLLTATDTGRLMRALEYCQRTEGSLPTGAVRGYQSMLAEIHSTIRTML